MCFDSVYKYCSEHFSCQKEFNEILSQMYIRLHVKYLLGLSYFNKS